MNKLAVIGHFGFGKNLLNGQTIKTKIITDELERYYGNDHVKRYDTHGGLSFLLKMPLMLFLILKNNKNAIIMPGINGLQLMLPFIVLFNTLFKRKILYIVIGGWLPEVLKRCPHIVWMLKHIDGIFVETTNLKTSIEQYGLYNCVFMPNCKRIIITDDTAPRYSHTHLPLCIFSRVMKEKGIGDAIEAVKKANDRIGKDVFSLDIYGQVWKGQEEWFATIMEGQPKYIQYKGCVDYSHSVDTLKKYFALLFPTYYSGECFAGTIIDGFAAGLPVIASDWHENPKIINDGKTGKLFPAKSVMALANILFEIFNKDIAIDSMRSHCVEEAKKYQPEIIIQAITSRIK